MVMEGSFSFSSMSKNTSDNHFLDHQDDQESGWTAYFEDFSNNGSSFDTSSMVSDAASLPAMKPSVSYNHGHVVACSSYLGPPNQMPKKLTFKKTRTKEVSHHDDSLEDTASSPVNSPKVCETTPTDYTKHQRKTFEHFSSSLGKGGSSLEQYERVETEESCEMANFNIRENECADLKKRGLCLVPLSMLVNYLG